MKQLLNAFNYAWQGIKYSVKHERNMKIHFLGVLFLISSGFLLDYDYIEWCLGILVATLVISAELFNTAIEALVDRVSPEEHPLAKVVKDCAAGAVMIMAIAAFLIWLFILIQKVG